MNDKDKEAFEKWLEAQNWYYDSFDNEYYQNGLKISIYGETEEAWQAACEYKQQEIDELKNVTYWTVEQDGKITRHISMADIEKLQAENIKLKREIEVLRQYSNKDCTAMADEVLKELDNQKGETK